MVDQSLLSSTLKIADLKILEHVLNLDFFQIHKSVLKMSKRESDGSIKNAAHNNAIGDGMTGDTVVGDNQTGDKPESQESLLKIFTGNG